MGIGGRSLADWASPVFEADPFSDSPGIAFGGIELVPGLDVLLEATSSLDGPLTLATLNHWHQRLFGAGPDGLRAIRIGELRDGAPMQVLSGAIGRERLHFEAPPRDQLDGQLGAFLGWIAAPPAQLDGLVRSGLAPLRSMKTPSLAEQLIQAEPMGLQGPSETCRNKVTKAVLM